MNNNRFARIFLLGVIMISLAMMPLDAHARAITETYRLENVTEELLAWNTCLGAVKGTLTYDATIHVTENPNSYQSVLIMNGVAVVEPLSPQYSSFTGQFSEIQVTHSLKDQDFMVWIVTQMGEDLEFHITFKVSYEEPGAVIKIFNIACGN